MVPPPPPPPAPPPPASDDELLEGEESGTKATLDESDIGDDEDDDDVPRSQQKVELDLDDAPFLEDEDEDDDDEEDVEEISLDEEPEEEESQFKRLLRNKKVLIGLAVLFVFILAVPVKIWLFPEGEKVVEEVGKVELEPEEPKKPETVEYTISFKPFWVEKTAPDGTVHFIHTKFSFTTTDPALQFEVRQKTFIIRDAIYYYLRNKEYDFLADMNNLEALKEDILSVINKFLGTSQVETLLVEEYLVQ